MRVWADVYNPAGTKLTTVTAIISAGVRERLDEAGSFNLQCTASDERALTYLVRGNEVRIYVQEDAETPQLWGAGLILRRKVDERENGIGLNIEGRDLLTELRRPTVGLGRTYEEQTVETIIDDLVELVGGWTVSYETATGARLQTARYDGAKVLKALVRTVEELGVHFRNGETPRVLEVGAFGTAATTDSGLQVRLIKPPSSITRELYDADEIVLVDEISVTEDDDEIVNYMIPIGAGEGSAATTLKDTSYRILNASDNSIYRAGIIPTYPIYRRVNDFGIEEYAIDASAGGDRWEEVTTFKEIAPVANSDLARQLASDALADAAMADLTRRREALVTYALSVQKARLKIRPGELVRLTYRGIVPIRGIETAMSDELTYIDVDEDLWVMAVQRNISDSGIRYDFEVSTIDRLPKTAEEMMVEVVESVEARNVSVQNIVTAYEKSSWDTVQWGSASYWQKRASFPLLIDNEVLDIISVKLNFRTRPLSATTTFDHYNGLAPNDSFLGSYAFQVRESTNYPRNIRLFINGVNVTTALGGPWGPSNAAVNVSLDISPYIIEAAGGIYQEHLIEFECEEATGSDLVQVVIGSTSVVNTSHGFIHASTRVLAVARAIVPT